jgi:hypothetical protein
MLKMEEWKRRKRKRVAIRQFRDMLFRSDLGTGATFELVFTRNNWTGRARGECCRYNTIHIVSEAQATCDEQMGTKLKSRP